MMADVDSTGSVAQIIGSFDFTASSARQIFYLSTFIANDAVNIFDYNSYYNRAPYHYPDPDPNNPAGSWGLRYPGIIHLPQLFSPTENGYFSMDPTYGQDDDGGDTSCFVTYAYNDMRNFVPDGPKLGNGHKPRMIMVTDDKNPVNYTDALTLTANSPILISSLFMTVAYFIFNLLLL